MTKAISSVLSFLPHILVFSFAFFSFSCQENSGKELATKNDKDTIAPKPPGRNLTNGKGSLSFRMDGQLYETDPKRTKCWSTSTTPLAMLMAYGEGLTVSWQMGYTSGQSAYKLDGDKMGSVNFTIAGKTY